MASKFDRMVRCVGVGWAKTGTTTLGECFKILGFEHLTGPNFDLVDQLANGKVESVLARLDGFDTTEDWPWPLLVPELAETFPEAKFVLTTRDPESWLRSWQGMVDRESPGTERRQRRIREFIYEVDFPNPDPEAMLARVDRHNASVREVFKGQPDRLLEIDWSEADGWTELCAFLDVGIPDAPFPHANSALSSSRHGFGHRVRRRVRRLRSR